MSGILSPSAHERESEIPVGAVHTNRLINVRMEPSGWRRGQHPLASASTVRLNGVWPIYSPFSSTMHPVGTLVMRIVLILSALRTPGSTPAYLAGGAVHPTSRKKANACRWVLISHE